MGGLNAGNGNKLNGDMVTREEAESICLKPGKGLFAGHPVLTSRHELDRIVDRPKQSFDSTSAAPALLVAQNHGLQVKSING